MTTHRLLSSARPSLSTSEAAHALGVSSATVRRMVRKGRLPAFRLSDGPQGHLRVPAQAVDEITKRAREARA
jgi:excisionase family DNA binding protein